MLVRRITRELRKRLAAYPAVALLGPRQSGKTTLGQSLGGAYFDLEQEPERLRLNLEWDDRVAARDLLILDEAQTWPEVFPLIRGAIDRERKRNGTQVSESLAGRLSQIELTPFLWTELKKPTVEKRLWLCGGYPDGGILAPRRYPRWQLDYLALLAQRDLPVWGLPAKPQVTDRLLRMLAAVHGQVWNASQLAQSLGLSYKTVNTYLDFLTGAFLIRRLQPYQPNVRKRLVKSAKIYWRDTGLLHAILNVPDHRALLFQPWVGASWEGFVIEQVLGELSSRWSPYHQNNFRTSDGYEVDLVLDFGTDLFAIEIKLTTSPSPADMNRLDKVADMIGASRRFLVSQARRSTGDDQHASCNLPGLIDRLAAACRDK
jgi:predicted AAA+ superfamily ATPase